MAFEVLHVPVPGGEIFATRRGAGSAGLPRVLLLHGGPGMGAEYLVRLLEELEDVIDGVLPQQRGLEPSTLEGPRDIETHVADEIAVLDELGWDRAWLMGHSWGGLLAMHLAVAHPERVSGLVLFDTMGAIPDGGGAAFSANLVARLEPAERRYLDELVARQERGDDDPMLVAEILATLWPSYSYVHGNVLPPRPLRLEVPIPDVPDTMDSVRAHWAAGTLERGLPGLDLPALLIHGVADPLPSSVSVETAALIPGARVELIERSGHFPWLERRGDIRPMVEAFLAEGLEDRQA
ncbi:MAG TPA: alpha/beta fold hydrolase [Candidatus Limnocylindrales bacterium]